MGIIFRPGEKGDSKKIAEMIDTASGGVVEYLFHGLIPGMPPVQVVAHNLENDNYPHTYKSTIVACDRDELVGMSLSYPSSYHKITDEMRSYFPADRLEHFNTFYSSRVENTWFIDALCVTESHRKLSIGQKLISLTKEKALENGYMALSLIVFADNALALPVYERTGFKIVHKVEMRKNEFIKHEGCCLLMICEITT